MWGNVLFNRIRERFRNSVHEALLIIFEHIVDEGRVEQFETVMLGPPPASVLRIRSIPLYENVLAFHTEMTIEELSNARKE